MNSANSKLVLGILLLLVGALVIPTAMLVPAFDAPNEEVVFESPGQATLQIEAPGRFYLWHEYQTLHEGRKLVRDEHLPDGMSFEVIRTGDGSTLSLQPRGNIHIEIGDAESRSIGYVDIERPGSFRIEVGGGDDELRVMSFSRSRSMLFTRAIGSSLVSLVVLGASGIALIIFGIGQRAREGRESRKASG